jgi:CheY-like chemotaxis protein
MSRAKATKVLIVDDNRNSALCMSEMIDALGFQCDVANDGQEAIERLNEGEYDLVIADTQMPKVSGIALLKFIRKNYPHIIVAIISTRDSEFTQNIVTKSKPDFYLPKPVSVAYLEDIISQL